MPPSSPLPTSLLNPNDVRFEHHKHVEPAGLFWKGRAVVGSLSGFSGVFVWHTIFPSTRHCTSIVSAWIELALLREKATGRVWDLLLKMAPPEWELVRAVSPRPSACAQRAQQMAEATSGTQVSREALKSALKDMAATINHFAFSPLPPQHHSIAIALHGACAHETVEGIFLMGYSSSDMQWVAEFVPGWPIPWHSQRLDYYRSVLR